VNSPLAASPYDRAKPQAGSIADKVKTIIFDFGNVLAFFDHRLTSARLARYSDLSSEEIHAVLWGSPLEDAFESGQIKTDEFLDRVRAACNLTCSDAELKRAYADIFWPNLQICELLPRLKRRYRLVLASNTTELHTNHFRRQFADALAHFDALGFSHDAGARKPRPAFYHYIQELAGCAPKECLFIDDLPANVEAGREHGWHGVQYRDFADLRQNLAKLNIPAS
jgi:putative hydrolase of the HAD superfamily